MALQKAIKTGGDFLDLRELADAGPVLAVFRIREFHAPELGEHGYLLPTIADVFIASGPQQGEVHPGERFIGAITSALRGVRNPNKQKGEQPQAPANAIGAEIAVRLDVKNKGKGNAFAIGDAPSDAEMAAIEQAYTAAGGEALWNVAPAGQVPAQGAAPAMAAAGNGRPW